MGRGSHVRPVSLRVWLAQALRMCKLYVLTHPVGACAPRTGGGWRRTRVRRKAKMAELHYMEMGWSGSGWMDPLPSESTPSSTPSSSPSFDFDEPASTSRSG